MTTDAKSSQRLKSLEDCLLEFTLADDSVVRGALNNAKDLRNFSASVSEELSEARKDAVKECVANADRVAQLHTQIVACDDVFQRLETMLVGFQSDLGNISEDMKRLQSQSVVINQELENRQKVRGELSQFVDDLIVPQQMIKIILEADVSDHLFLEQLHELHRKLQFLKAQEFKDAKAIYDVQNILESLKFKVIEKIREWILVKIYMFRKPLSNYQVPQHQMLKQRFFFEFLLTHERNIAREIQDEYVETIGKMFFSYFKVYVSRLFKLMMTDAASKEDLLGAEDTVKSSGFTAIFGGAKPQVRNRATVFSLGSRQTLLNQDLLAPLIVPHAAQEANQKFQFESLFRSIQLAFVDHCSHEYLFIADFFLLSNSQALEFHAKVMSRAMSLLIRNLQEKIAVDHDVISLYLCICLCDRFRALLIQRQIPPMNGYWEAIANYLWTRLDQVMQLHMESVRALDVRKLHPPVDTRPHYIIRRYGELTCAFLVVTEACEKEKLSALLESCEDAVEQLLIRMSATMSQQRLTLRLEDYHCSSRLFRDRLVFLINNYRMVLDIIDERVTQDSRIYSIIHELEQKAITEFVERTLHPHFGSLISFVAECEPLVKQQHTHLLVRYNDRMTSMVEEFNSSWKHSIDLINGEIVKSFTNFKNGTNILQAAFTQLMQYIQRFSKIVSHDVFRESLARTQMVNVHHIMAELKKYKPVY